jgi:hypothetical protein
MNQNTSRTPASQNSPKQGNQPDQGGGNSPITFIAIIVGVIVVGAVAYKAMHKETPAPDANATNTAPADAQVEKSSKVQPHEPGTSSQSAAASAPAPGPTPAVPEAKAPVTGAAKDIVNSLAALDPKKGPITKEQAEKFKTDLKALIAQGKDAVPAIREFLDRNVELSYANAGGESLGYSSLRASLIDALAQIGGPDATSALLSTLNTTALPGEIAQLARALEQIAPGQYGADIMNAVRQTLEEAMRGGLGKEDVGVLFDMIAKSAANGQIDPALIGDLVKAAQTYKWYPVIALANLPGDQGIDALIAMSKDPNAPNTVAEMLGQKAWESDKALNALIDLARAGKITPAEYQQIFALMSGDEYLITQKGAQQPQGVDCQYYHIEYNNQNFSRCRNPNYQPDKGIAALNKLRDAVPDPNVRTSAQDWITKVQGRGK